HEDRRPEGASSEEITEAVCVAAEMRAGGAYAHSAPAPDALGETHAAGVRATESEERRPRPVRLVQNECSGAGNEPSRTASAYAAAASPSAVPTSPNRRTNLAVFPVVYPAMSCQTSTCPSQCGPAPMPTVGMDSLSVTCAAT